MKTAVQIVIPIVLVVLLGITYAKLFQAEAELHQRQADMNQIIQGGYSSHNNMRFCELVRLEPRLFSQQGVVTWAVEHGDKSANELVIQQGDKVLSPALKYDSPVVLAMWRGDPEILELYFAAGIDPNAWYPTLPIFIRFDKDYPLRRSFDYHPEEPLLHAACRDGSPEVIELLLRHGADIQVRNEIGDTCLFAAAEWKRPEVARLLLSHGIDPEAQDSKGHTVETWLRSLKVDTENAERWPELDEILAILVHWRQHGSLPEP